MTSDPAILLLAALAAAVLLGAVFAWLVRIARHPLGAERTVALLLGLLVLETALYSDQSLIPVGLFHPEAGGLSFRLFDILIPLALAARIATGGRIRTVPVQALLWSAFLLWLACAAIQGLLIGNPGGLVAFHAKAIIYLGVFPLVAAVAPERWVESPALRRVVVASSIAAAVLLITSQAHLALDVGLPLLPLSGFGPLGSDAASLFAVLGLGALIVGLCSDRGRLGAFAVAVPLLGAPLAAGQRAAMVGLAASFGLALALLALRWQRIRVMPAEVGLCVLAAGALVCVLVLASLLGGGTEVRLPLQNEIQQAFTSRGKQLSEQDRINQWRQVRDLIAEQPWTGWGLGKEYDYYSPGFFAFMRTDITHNIAFDLLLRTGIAGLLLFAAALAASLRDALAVWFTALDARVAAIGLACGTALVGLFTKGMFESLLEKYRLAILIGGLVGVSASIALTRAAPAVEQVRNRRELRPGALAR